MGDTEEASGYHQDKKPDGPYTVVKEYESEEFLPRELLQDMLDTGWRRSPRWQEDTFAKMNTVWPSFTTEEKLRAFENSVAHVNRLIITPDEAKFSVFSRIMLLKGDTKVNRALMWDPSRWPEYVPEPWEKDYLNLPGWIGRFVDCYKESIYPAPFFAWSGISTMGVCSKYNIYVQVGGTELLHNLYTFFVGSASSGKSYAQECAKSILHLLNERVNTVCALQQGTNSLEAAFRPIKQRADLHINMFMHEATHESLVETLAEIRKIPVSKVMKDNNGDNVVVPAGWWTDATGVLLVDEVSEHFGKSDWAADKKIAIYTSMYSSSERSRSTLSRGKVSYDHQAFSMMVAGAIEWFKGAVTPAMLHGGFMDRANFIYRGGTHRIYTALEMAVIDPLKEEDLAEDLVGLITPPTSHRRRVEFLPGAANLLNDISRKEMQHDIDIRDLKIPKSEDYRSTPVRREHFKIKLSSIFATSDSVGPGPLPRIKAITNEHVILAQKMVVNEDVYFRKFIEAVNMTGATEFCIWLRDQFIKSGWDPIPQSRLAGICYKKPKFKIHTKDDFYRKMDILAESGVVWRKELKKRPRQKAAGAQAWESRDDHELWRPYV